MTLLCGLISFGRTNTAGLDVLNSGYGNVYLILIIQFIRRQTHLKSNAQGFFVYMTVLTTPCQGMQNSNKWGMCSNVNGSFIFCNGF